MALRDILLYPHEVLATRAAPIAQVDDATRQLIEDMAQTMYHAPGIGLAAPQIGVLQRLTVIDVSPREEVEGEEDLFPEGRHLQVFVNPEIVRREGKIQWQEGCLSIPGVYEKVDRSAKIVVQALDGLGREFELEADGLLAVCIQHELDHLDGIVFFDRLSPLKRRMALKKYKRAIARAEEDAAEEAQAQRPR